MEGKILNEERIDTDVLVLGAGAGGMMAAISAAEQGGSVTLCEKGAARRDQCLQDAAFHSWQSASPAR